MGREMRGRFKSEGTYVYLWRIHVDVWQKATEFCKQFPSIKNKFKKMNKHVMFILISDEVDLNV